MVAVAQNRSTQGRTQTGKERARFAPLNLTGQDSRRRCPTQMLMVLGIVIPRSAARRKCSSKLQIPRFARDDNNKSQKRFNPDLASSRRPARADRRRNRKGQRKAKPTCCPKLWQRLQTLRAVAPASCCDTSDTLLCRCRRPALQIRDRIACRRTRKLASGCSCLIHSKIRGWGIRKSKNPGSCRTLDFAADTCRRWRVSFSRAGLPCHLRK